MIFKNVYLKLTGLYVLIIIVISIFFSLVLYRISTIEIGRGLARQTLFIQNLPSYSGIDDDIQQIRINQIVESNHRIFLYLLSLNIFILIGSSFLSYYLAKKTMKPVEDAMISQSQFTADASHELRTPLTAMKTEIEVALRDKSLDTKEAKNLLKSNLEEISKLEYLSSTLLKLARSEDQENQLFDQVALDVVIEEALKKVKSLALKKEIIIKVEQAHLFVLGDKPSLVELMVILLDNAIKYSPVKTTIHISLIQEKDHALVKIKDHGIGIKASDIPHVFRRFYRADISRSKEKVLGYGLGLSIAQKIAEVHGARINVQSAPGKGTEFTLAFRIAK